jgi:CAAX protease family protein
MVSGSRTTRDIWTFLTLLFVFGGAFYALVLLRPGAPKQWGTYALPFMWCPGLAALITKLVRDRTLRGLGWGWGRTHYFLIAYGLAIAICLLPYLVVWFAFEAFNGSQLVEAFAKEGLPSALRGQAAMLAVVLVLLPLTGLIAQPARRSAGGAFSSRGCTPSSASPVRACSSASSGRHGTIRSTSQSCLSTAQMSRAGTPTLVSLLSSSGSASCTPGFGCGPIVCGPSALFHAAGNAFQSILQAATLETSVTSYLTTEYGASFAAVGGLLAFIFWRKRREVGPAPVLSEAGGS